MRAFFPPFRVCYLIITTEKVLAIYIHDMHFAFVDKIARAFENMNVNTEITSSFFPDAAAAAFCASSSSSSFYFIVLLYQHDVCE